MTGYHETIQKAARWVNTQMLSFDNGYYGIYERIRIDLHQRTSWCRPDCAAGYLRVLQGLPHKTPADEALAENLLAWLERTQDTRPLSVWRGSLPFYLVDGHLAEGGVDASLYQNDNGKVLLALCQVYAQTKTPRLLAVAEGIADYWMRAQQPDGTFGVIDGKCMQECARGPCFVQWLAAGLLALYEQTGRGDCLGSAQRAMAYLTGLILEDGRCRTSYELIRMEDWRPASSEAAIMALVLAEAARITGTPGYAEKMHKVTAWLLRLQHESGGILNCVAGDAASLQDNPRLCDLVYTQGFALQALVAAWGVSHRQEYLDAAHRLGAFLAAVQCRGESPLWDGGWRGSWNVDTGAWDGRADQNNKIDEGGMYSVYTGWCCTEIVYGLQQLERAPTPKEQP